MIKFNPKTPLPFFEMCAKRLESENSEEHSTIKKKIKGIIADYADRIPVQNALKEMAKSRKVSHQVLGRWSLDRLGRSTAALPLFPYSIDDKAGTVCTKRYTSGAKANDFPECKATSDYLGFVVNMPVVINGMDAARTDEKIARVLDTLRDEGFSFTAEKSQERCLTDLCVVLGGNRCKSIDKERNSAFKDYIKNFSGREGINTALFGFMWEPRWVEGKRSVGIKDVRNYYNILKRLDKTRAESERKKFEQPEGGINDRVPYQQIRETVKNSKSTKMCVEYLRKINKDRSVYLSIMDPDFVRLRNDERGVFSHYNNLVYYHEKKYRVKPAVASTGYKAPSNEREIFQIGIELDQRVREAVGTVLPLAPYLPEPNMIVLVEDDENTVTESFINEDSRNKESRHIVADVIKNRRLDPTHAIAFQTLGAISTTIPVRFYTAKNRTLCVTNKTIGSKQVLKSLRGIRQSNINPLWGWAMNVENALSKRGDQVRKQLSFFFKLYDPIYLTYNQQKTKYSAGRNFEPMMKSYEVHARAVNEAILFFKNTADVRKDFLNRYRMKSLIRNAQNEFSKIRGLTKQQKDNSIALYKKTLETFVEAFNASRKLGLSEGEIFSVAEASRLSGKAIYDVLYRVKQA